MNWGDWRPPESQSSLIQSLSHFGSCDTRSHDNQVGGQSGYLFDQGNIPHMPACNLEIKEGMQTCNSSLESCNKLLLDHLKKNPKTLSKAVLAPNLMKTQRLFSGGWRVTCRRLKLSPAQVLWAAWSTSRSISRSRVLASTQHGKLHTLSSYSRSRPPATQPSHFCHSIRICCGCQAEYNGKLNKPKEHIYLNCLTYLCF